MRSKWFDRGYEASPIKLLFAPGHTSVHGFGSVYQRGEERCVKDLLGFWCERQALGIDQDADRVAKAAMTFLFELLTEWRRD